MNRDERMIWIMHDEMLHGWWLGSRMGLDKFVRLNRKTIDAEIKRIKSRHSRRNRYCDRCVEPHQGRPKRDRNS